MHWLTEDALIVCKHRLGKVEIETSQEWVTIDSGDGPRRILVERDPEGREINGCPMYGAGIRPCKTTLVVRAGYSDLLRIDERRICLDTVTGLTDGTPPGTVDYIVADPGQRWTSEL